MSLKLRFIVDSSAAVPILNCTLLQDCIFTIHFLLAHPQELHTLQCYDVVCYCTISAFLRNSASSFHWLSSSIFTVCLFVRSSSSRIGNTSSHLHYMMFQTIQTIYFLWGYDPGNMLVSFITELSPIYCCLVFQNILENIPTK